MATQDFQVYIQGTGGGSPEDWKRAMHAPEQDLPKLSKEQAEIAKRMEIAEKDYARGVLAGAYAEERNKLRGEQLGKYISQVLSGSGSEYALTAVIRQGTDFRWVARIETPTGVKSVTIPLDLADDVIDSAMPGILEKLRRLVLGAIDREDLVIRKTK
jgi:hypothetical protein